jgi:hypothetical protein
MTNDELISRLMDNQENIQKELAGINQILVKQESNLDLHMRRSDALEKRIEQVDSDVRPIKKHVETLNHIAKLFGVFSAVLAVGTGLVRIVQFFLK